LDYSLQCDSKNVNLKLDNNNYIMYCLNHLYNYNNVINLLTKISPSQLKYSRKILIGEKYFNMSDVHFEIDFELLGVNEYNIFFEFYSHIKDNFSYNKKIIYIVCLHFNLIKKELLEVFNTFFDTKNIKFIFCTNQYSFITDDIKENSILCKIPNKKPSVYNKTYKKACNDIITYIKTNKINLFKLRELIYTLLIKNYNLHDAFQFIIFELISMSYINDSNINNVMKYYTKMIKQFNNNYRAIYHIEGFMLYLINLKK
jgi:hypothetical protein